MYEVCSVLDTNRSIVVSENQNRLKLCIHIIYSIRLFINIPLTDLSLFRVIRPQHRANQSLSILDTNRRTVIKYALQNGVHGNLNCFSIHICSIYFKTAIHVSHFRLHLNRYPVDIARLRLRAFILL